MIYIMGIKKIEAFLPYPPALNHIWRMHNNSIYLSPEARKYKDHVRDVLAWEGDCIWKSEMLALHVVSYPPDRRTRDIDGILKALLDAIPSGVGGIWADDSQIAELSVLRKYEEGMRGCVFVSISKCRKRGVKKL